jgi:hypothetical protein
MRPAAFHRPANPEPSLTGYEVVMRETTARGLTDAINVVAP